MFAGLVSEIGPQIAQIFTDGKGGVMSEVLTVEQRGAGDDTDPPEDRERPILFSGAMVSAILRGEKSQTRRVVKGWVDYADWGHAEPIDTEAWREEFPGAERGDWVLQAKAGPLESGLFQPMGCPYGAPGDRLWVRETWRIVGWDFEDGDLRIAYRDGTERSVSIPKDIDPEGDLFQRYALQCCDDCEKAGRAADSDGFYRFTDETIPTRWRPSIHMPRWACRLVLEVVDVRVERLEDISEEDAVAEGIKRTGGGGEWGEESLIEDFAALWDSINGKRAAWDLNPWVWVVSFRRV